MQFDDGTRRALDRIFPLLPWALTQVQEAITPLLFADLTSGTRAAVVHNAAMSEGDRRFADDPEIEVRRSQGLQHFVLPNYLIRVKRGERRTLGIANNRTRQTAEWTQVAFEGMPHPSNRLHLVYIPDESWTVVTRCIIAPYRGKYPLLPWHEIDVDRWYEARGASVEPFAPDQPIPPLTLKPSVTPLPLEEVNESP